MLSRIQTLPRLEPATPGFLTPSELQFYLRVGKNEVSAIAHRFDIPRREGRYREADVWAQLFEVAPTSEAGMALLRVQLQDITWVAGRLGRSASTIRERLRSGSFDYPCGVQLGQEGSRTPRLRRWLPGPFEAALAEEALTDLRFVPRRVGAACATHRGSVRVEDTDVRPEPGAIFAAIAAGAGPRPEAAPP
jgi:hypothetical protein